MTSVKVTDNKHIRINFSEAIDPESVVLKITKQSDNSAVTLDSISPVDDNKQSVDLTLDDVLVEASSYTLTIIAGIGVSGSTITDGASALLDFITPSPLKVWGDETLNAPSNPNAVLTEPTSTTPLLIQQTPPASSSGKTDPAPVKQVEAPAPVPTEELPLTGPNTLFFLMVSIPLAYFLIRRRSI